MEGDAEEGGGGGLRMKTTGGGILRTRAAEGLGGGEEDVEGGEGVGKAQVCPITTNRIKSGMCSRF